MLQIKSKSCQIQIWVVKSFAGVCQSQVICGKAKKTIFQVSFECDEIPNFLNIVLVKASFWLFLSD